VDRKEGLQRVDIQAELVRARTSQAQVALELGISAGTVSKVLAGKLGIGRDSAPGRRGGAETRARVLQLVHEKTGIPLADLEDATTAAAVAA
jgi:predicted transcriptional regulator